MLPLSLLGKGLVRLRENVGWVLVGLV
jgi:hypothetical protein